jgi:hypothetical protein
MGRLPRSTGRVLRRNWDLCLITLVASIEWFVLVGLRNASLSRRGWAVALIGALAASGAHLVAVVQAPVFLRHARLVVAAAAAGSTALVLATVVSRPWSITLGFVLAMVSTSTLYPVVEGLRRARGSAPSGNHECRSSP